MRNPARKITFSDLDNVSKPQNPAGYDGPIYPLQRWYLSVCDIPLTELSLEDLCIACRQDVHLDEVVPICLNRLHENPLAGEKYDGELAVALRGASTRYWNSHPLEKDRLLVILRESYEQLQEEELQPEMLNG